MQASQICITFNRSEGQIFMHFHCQTFRKSMGGSCRCTVHHMVLNTTCSHLPHNALHSFSGVSFLFTCLQTCTSSTALSFRFFAVVSILQCAISSAETDFSMNWYILAHAEKCVIKKSLWLNKSGYYLFP